MYVFKASGTVASLTHQEQSSVANPESDTVVRRVLPVRDVGMDTADQNDLPYVIYSSYIYIIVNTT